MDLKSLLNGDYIKKEGDNMPAGRPKKEIDYVTVEKLANIQCTQDEIASFLGISTRTLQRDEQFMELFNRGRENGKMSLRRIQWKHAEKSVPMAIWLGKQYLGQRDKVEYTDDGMKAINDNINNIANLLNNPKKNRTEEDV